MSEILSRITSFFSPKTTTEQTTKSFLANSETRFSVCGYQNSVKATGLNIDLNCDLFPNNGVKYPSQKMGPCVLIANGLYPHSYPKTCNKYFFQMQNIAMPILKNIDQFCKETITVKMIEKSSPKSCSQSDLFVGKAMDFNFMPAWKKAGFEPHKKIPKPANHCVFPTNYTKKTMENTTESSKIENIKKPEREKIIDCFNTDIVCTDKQIQMCGNSIIDHILGFDDDNDTDFESDCDEMSMPPTDIEYSSSESENEDDNCIWEQVTSCRKPWTCDRKFRDKKSLSFTTSSYESSSDSECSEDENDLFRSSNQPQMHYENNTDSESQDSDVESICEEEQVDLLTTLYDTNTTVERPTCSNEKISFILGYDTSDSEVEQEFQARNNYFHQDSLTHPTTEPKLTENNLSTTSDHCELWDYFVKFHEPFVETFSSCLKPEKKPVNLETKKKCQLEKIEGIIPRKPSMVRFNDKVIEHPMVAWSFAYKKARKGEWETYARDRERFNTRIFNVERDISWCLNKEHREKIFGKI